MLQKLDDPCTLAHSQNTRVGSCSYQILYEKISTGVREKQPSPTVSGTITPCHTYQDFFVCYYKYLTYLRD